MITAAVLIIVFLIILCGFMSMRKKYNLLKKGQNEYILFESTVIFYNFVLSEKQVRVFTDKGEAMEVFMDLVN